MNYLVSSFDCVLIGENRFTMLAGAKYKFIDPEDVSLIIPYDGIPLVLDFKRKSENVLQINYKHDKYYFLFRDNIEKSFHTQIKYKNKEIFVSLSSVLSLTIDGVLICEKNVENLKYSHYEMLGNICFIYFIGKRNYVVALEDEKLVFASYYDECNVCDDEKYFMCRLYDCLNHGKVFHIKNNQCLSYLVYLDDEEMNLKHEFVPLVFLDCLLAENFKYCNHLLCDSLRLDKVEDIKGFFPEFDFYYPITPSTIVLINKNTLAGIFEFDIENNLIVNIKQC